MSAPQFSQVRFVQSLLLRQLPLQRCDSQLRTIKVLLQSPCLLLPFACPARRRRL